MGLIRQDKPLFMTGMSHILPQAILFITLLNHSSIERVDLLMKSEEEIWVYDKYRNVSGKVFHDGLRDIIRKFGRWISVQGRSFWFRYQQYVDIFRSAVG